MKKITLICVGNLKEKYLLDAQNEYTKRIKKFFDLNIVEIAEEKLLKSEKDIEKALDKEAEKIYPLLKNKKVFCLCIEGSQFSSEDFSKKVDEATNLGEICFVIGSSFGISKKLKEISTKISFSKMTFPHQLMRIIFLEQLYRAGTILNNIQYHK